MMKKTILIPLFALMLSGIATAQTAYDALRYSQNRYEGTARSVSMGNAFTGLGGEIGAININPASSALYRYSEFVITPTFGRSVSEVNYLDTKTREGISRVGLSNVGFVIPFNTGRNSGLVNFNIALNYNKTDDYNYRSMASGVNGQSSWLSAQAAAATGIHNSHLDIIDGGYDPFFESSAPWKTILLWNSSLLSPLGEDGLNYYGATENIDDENGTISLGGPINQEFYQYATGFKSRFDINFSWNISNFLFFGMNIGIQDISYRYYESMGETAVNPSDFQSGFNRFNNEYRLTTTGSGFDFNFGIIAKPVKGLSIGASISTPAWLYLKDNYDESIYAHMNAVPGHDEYKQSIESPLGEYNYRINTPFRWSVGAAYVFGKFMVISADYENIDYSKAAVMNSLGNRSDFRDVNNEIISTFKSSDIFRAGLEVRPAEFLSLRAGYNYYGYADKNDTFGQLHTCSAGIGISSKGGFFADLAYLHYFNTKESFSLYNDVDAMTAPIGNKNDWKFKFLLSLGFRF